DERGRQAVVERLGGVSDVFERTLLWGSLWDAIREAGLAPRDFVELALRLLPNETDEALAQNLIGHVTIGLHRYVNQSVRAELVPRAETLASDLMLHSANQDLRIILFRALRHIAERALARAQLKALHPGKLTVPVMAP